MGSPGEGGKESHVGHMELKLSSWLSLIICANYVMFVCFGSVTGTEIPIFLSSTQPGEFQALDVRAWVTSVTRRGWLSTQDV